MARPARAERPYGGRNTQEKILEAAEKLFGERGLEAVSLRQVAVAAGSANHLSVQYHFGDKAGLVRAILQHRLPQLEVQRAKLLSEARAAKRVDDPVALFDAIMRPIAQERDHEGRRSFAAFLLGVERFPALKAMRTEAADMAPLTGHIIELLHEALDVPTAVFRRRLNCASELYLACVVMLDDKSAPPEWRLSEEDVLADALSMTAAVLQAPAGTAAE